MPEYKFLLYETFDEGKIALLTDARDVPQHCVTLPVEGR